MQILFTRFPYESANGGATAVATARGGAENQTMWLMEGLAARGHDVRFLGDCPVLLRRTAKLKMENGKLKIGRPPVTKWLAVSFLWRKNDMQRMLIQEIEKLITNNQKPDTIVMLSLTEKLLLTEWATEQDIKVFWVEHDRIGHWLTWNPWLPKLRKLSALATTICVSELSWKKYVELGWNAQRTIAIPNGVPVPLSPRPFPRRGKGKAEKEFYPKSPTKPVILEFARDMRKNPTKAEKFLWQFLRFDQLGVRFRRQHPVKSRILDFYCHEYRLGIELDGEYHASSEQEKYDRERTEAFGDFEIRIIRFRNEEVFENPQKVVQYIQRIVSPPPSAFAEASADRSGEGSRLVSPPPSGEGSGVGEQKTLHLGCLARLSHEKGIDVLLHAIADLPEVTLTVVGTGPEEGYLRQLMTEDERRLGVSRIALLPHVPDLEEFYASLDAFVLPSSDHDPFGLAAAEAMVRGIPTIVTDACGIAGHLVSGEHVLIVQAGSSEALREAIQTLYSLGTRDTLAEAGSVFAREHFGVEKMVDQYERLLSDSPTM